MSLNDYLLLFTLLHSLVSSLLSFLNRETVAEENSGIEGILSRLEKERNSSLGIDLGKPGHTSHTSSRDNIDDRSFGTSDAGKFLIRKQDDMLSKKWLNNLLFTALICCLIIIAFVYYVVDIFNISLNLKLFSLSF